METLIAVVRATPSVQVLEGVIAQGLLTQGDRVVGLRLAQVTNTSLSAPVDLFAPAVLLAGGGSGGLFALTTNPARIRGQVMGMAARAGARMADMEFVQFHPTAMDVGLDPAPLATEALRGAGASLVNADGERFLLGDHPDAELAPRDIVARAVFAQTKAGKRPSLDTRTALGAAILTDFPVVAEACRRAGIDPVTQTIPIAAAAHYHMGGVAVDQLGRSSLAGLWACGEAASTGLHGANRLASNGVLEALVFARACALDLQQHIALQDAAPVQLVFDGTGTVPDDTAVATLRQTMTTLVGVRRTEAGLRAALATIDTLQANHPDCPDFANMCATARLIAISALARRESRGAHWRDDFPQSDAAQATRSFITLDHATERA